MHDVAKGADVGVGTLYRHFPSKELLAGALLAQRFDVTGEAVRELSGRGDAPFTRLSRALWLCGERIAAHPVTQLVVTRAGPSARQHAEPSRLKLEEGFVPLVEDAHRDGSLRRDFAAEDVGVLMSAICATVDDAHPDRWQHMLEIAIDGLRTR